MTGFTKFTLNQTVDFETLKKNGAIPLGTHAEVRDGINTGVSFEEYGLWHTFKLDLPEAWSCIMQGHHSRNSLKKIFGSKAMVRGVSHH